MLTWRARACLPSSPSYARTFGILLVSPVKTLGHLHLSALIFTLTSFSCEFFSCSDHKVQARFCHFSKLFLPHMPPSKHFSCKFKKEQFKNLALINLGVAESFNTMWSPIISFSSWTYKLANLHFPGRFAPRFGDI